MSKGTVTLQVEEYERLRDIERSTSDKPCVIIQDSHSSGIFYRGFGIDEFNQELLERTNKDLRESRVKLQETKNDLRKAESEIYHLKVENKHLTFSLNHFKLDNERFGKMSLWQLLSYWFNR